MSRNSGFREGNVHVRGNNTGNGGLEVDSFIRLWARGNKASAPTALSPATADGLLNLNAAMKVVCQEEVISLGGAPSVLSTNNLLLANSIILYIVCTPVRDFSTPVTYDVGDTTTATRFATALTNDNVSEGPLFAKAHLSGTVAFTQATAGKLKIRPNAAGTGLLHVAVFQIAFFGQVA